MTKKGYTEVSGLFLLFYLHLKVIIDVLTKLDYFLIQVIRKKLHGKIKLCHTYKFKNTFFLVKTKSFRLNLSCTVEECNVSWSGTMDSDKIELKRMGKPNHHNAKKNRRTKISRTDSGINVF